MVLAAALISFAVLATQAEPQAAAPDTSKPYSVEGVRKALAGETPSSVDLSSVERDRRGYRMAVEYGSTASDPCGLVVTACRPSWSRAAYPTWHDQFVEMTGPQDYAVHFTPMSNVQRLEAVATNIGFGLAIAAITSAIHDQVVKTSHSRKQKKVEKIRQEIHGELDELERLNAAPRK